MGAVADEMGQLAVHRYDVHPGDFGPVVQTVKPERVAMCAELSKQVLAGGFATHSVVLGIT